MFHHYRCLLVGLTPVSRWSSKMCQGQGCMTNESQNPRCRVKLCSCAATAWSSCAEYASYVIRYYKILSSRYTFFLAGHGYHGMIGITSTAATATNDNFVYGMISSWSQNPGSSNYWYDKVWHNKVSFLQKLTVLRGVICRVKGVICREKGVICRNCETTHFQFCHSRFFRYHIGVTKHGRAQRT